MSVNFLFGKDKWNIESFVEKIEHFPGGKSVLYAIKNDKDLLNCSNKVYFYIVNSNETNPMLIGFDDKIIDEVKNKEAKLVVYFVDSLPSAYRLLDEYVKEKGLDKKDVLLFIPDFIMRGSRTFSYLYDNNYVMADAVLNEQKRLRQFFDFLFNESMEYLRNKHFLSFNGRCKPHRSVLLWYLYRKNYLKFGDVSWNSMFNQEITMESGGVLELARNIEFFDTDADYSNYYAEYHPEIRKLFDKLPLVLDKKENSRGLDPDKENYNTSYINLLLYFNSYIDIITQSWFVDNEYPDDIENTVYIDEKIWKSLVIRKPFLIIGQPNTLELLKKLGFKTFNNIFNEEYDKIVDGKKRMSAIKVELDKLMNKSRIEIDKLYWDSTEKLLHNSIHFEECLHILDDTNLNTIKEFFYE